MIEQTFLTNQFLIAMPALADPHFVRTVTYICEHSAAGALGIVINRPLDLDSSELLSNLGIQFVPGSAAQPVFAGGPVHQEQGFVLHRPAGGWGSSLAITDEIGITTSRDILEALGRGEAPADMLIALGYAGWGPGQLERELGDNAWLCGPADPAVMFRLPAEQRWAAAAALLGIDLTLLSAEAGHG